MSVGNCLLKEHVIGVNGKAKNIRIAIESDRLRISTAVESRQMVEQ